MVSFEAKALGAFAAGATAWNWADSNYHIAHDLGLIKRLAPNSRAVDEFAKAPGANVSMKWYETLAELGDSAATTVSLIQAETGEKLTFADVEALSNKISNWVASHPQLAPDTCIALHMENCIEYIPIWLGLTKAGIKIAMINSNIKGKPLAHSIKIADCVGVISSAGLCAHSVADAHTLIEESGVSIFSELPDLHQPEPLSSGLFTDLRREIASFPATLPKAFLKTRNAHIKHSGQVFGYIYTSGTTGLPKACKIPHYKIYTYTMIFPAFSATKREVIYGSGMPLYHSAANLGVMHMFNTGSTYVVRRKFSATNFWKECTQYGCTVMQYIGEMCRYLIGSPLTGFEDKHKIRLAIGNGLRPEIWNEFQRRHNVPEVGEFYGATEGNSMTMNLCRDYIGQGAVGRQGALLNKLKPVHLVKFDVEEEMPVRHRKTGFCIPLPEGETGELICEIKNKVTAAGEVPEFSGYTNKEATEKKILRDVFVKGDSYFRTGDLLRTKGGYVYFVDRIGDTFRWKGENVSTMEVSEVLSTFPGIQEASVYGVEIPGSDGRACMVAINLTAGAEINPEEFLKYCRANLPSYSVWKLGRKYRFFLGGKNVFFFFAFRVFLFFSNPASPISPVHSLCLSVGVCGTSPSPQGLNAPALFYASSPWQGI